jgi:hypothetical protein
MGVHSDPKAEASLRRIEERMAVSIDQGLASMAARAQQSAHYKRLWQVSEADNARLSIAVANCTRTISEQRDEIEALMRAVEGRRIFA